MERVFLKKAEDYGNSGAIERSVASLLDNCGMDLDYRGKKVVVKPNMLRKCRPEDRITTDPSVIDAVLVYLSQHGADDVTVFDSPGGVNTRESILASYRACGFADPAQKYGTELSCDMSYTEIQLSGGATVPISNTILAADYVFNICKLKTHSMAGLTASVKNLFGAVPGAIKAEVHLRFPERGAFCRRICEICAAAKPTVSICDAVIGMEGDGPSAGEPRKFGFLAASKDPYVLDRVLADLLGMRPEEAGTVEASISMGLAPKDVSEIEVAGDSISRITDLKRAKSSEFDFSGNLPAFLRPLYKAVSKRVAARPKVNTAECVGCGKCAEACPNKAIEIRDRKAHIDNSKCIKCYCCHELCPVKAVHVKKSVLRMVAR